MRLNERDKADRVPDTLATRANMATAFGTSAYCCPDTQDHVSTMFRDFATNLSQMSVVWDSACDANQMDMRFWFSFQGSTCSTPQWS